MSQVIDQVSNNGPLKPQELGPNSVPWGDLADLADFVTEKVGEFVSFFFPAAVVVEVEEESDEEKATRAPRWCRMGNACQWRNCMFRHERCEHYDRFVASRGKTRGCRCQLTDKDNCKSPEEGGCKYDHRDLSKLKVYVEKIEIKSEAEMLEYFYPLGLDCQFSDHYNLADMSKNDKGILLRSLEDTNSDLLTHYITGKGLLYVRFN
jgi:hypothetical protein